MTTATVPELTVFADRVGELIDQGLGEHALTAAIRDELSATLALVDAATNGITYTVEAGTVAHPDRVLAAFDRVGVGGTLGSWGWDVAGAPWSGSVAEVLDAVRARLAEHISDVRGLAEAGDPFFARLVGSGVLDALSRAARDLERDRPELEGA